MPSAARRSVVPSTLVGEIGLRRHSHPPLGSSARLACDPTSGGQRAARRVCDPIGRGTVEVLMKPIIVCAVVWLACLGAAAARAATAPSCGTLTVGPTAIRTGSSGAGPSCMLAAFERCPLGDPLHPLELRCRHDRGDVVRDRQARGCLRRHRCGQLSGRAATAAVDRERHLPGDRQAWGRHRRDRLPGLGPRGRDPPGGRVGRRRSRPVSCADAARAARSGMR